jgi:hypothetical protein
MKNNECFMLMVDGFETAFNNKYYELFPDEGTGRGESGGSSDDSDDDLFETVVMGKATAKELEFCGRLDDRQRPGPSSQMDNSSGSSSSSSRVRFKEEGEMPGPSSGVNCVDDCDSDLEDEAPLRPNLSLPEVTIIPPPILKKGKGKRINPSQSNPGPPTPTKSPSVSNSPVEAEVENNYSTTGESSLPASPQSPPTETIIIPPSTAPVVVEKAQVSRRGTPLPKLPTEPSSGTQTVRFPIQIPFISFIKKEPGLTNNVVTQEQTTHSVPKPTDAAGRSTSLGSLVTAANPSTSQSTVAATVSNGHATETVAASVAPREMKREREPSFDDNTSEQTSTTTTLSQSECDSTTRTPKKKRVKVELIGDSDDEETAENNGEGEGFYLSL